MLAHRGRLFFAHFSFALKAFINRFAEGIPELLLFFAIHRHALRLGLPAALQRFHGINAHQGRCTELFGFFDHRAAAIQRCFLRGFERAMRGFHRGFVLRL